MDVTIKVSTGRGVKSSLETKAVTIRDVVAKEQVMELLDKSFKDYFPPQAKLTDMKEGKQKK